MRSTLLIGVMSLALVTACDRAPNEAASESSAVPPAATSRKADPQALVRMGMIFSDNAPQWMGGAVIARGRIRVGDRLELLGSDGQRASVRIDAIKDDATQAQVTESQAPAGVFLTFTVDDGAHVSNDQVLAAAGAFNDFASAKAAAEPGDAPADG